MTGDQEQLQLAAQRGIRSWTDDDRPALEGLIGRPNAHSLCVEASPTCPDHDHRRELNLQATGVICERNGEIIGVAWTVPTPTTGMAAMQVVVTHMADRELIASLMQAATAQAALNGIDQFLSCIGIESAIVLDALRLAGMHIESMQQYGGTAEVLFRSNASP